MYANERALCSNIIFESFLRELMLGIMNAKDLESIAFC